MSQKLISYSFFSFDSRQLCQYHENFFFSAFSSTLLPFFLMVSRKLIILDICKDAKAYKLLLIFFLWFSQLSQYEDNFFFSKFSSTLLPFFLMVPRKLIILGICTDAKVYKLLIFFLWFSQLSQYEDNLFSPYFPLPSFSSFFP